MSYDNENQNEREGFIQGCQDCQTEKLEQEKLQHKEFGLFGLDFLATKRMMNRLLKPHGLKLKVTTSRGFGDQSEVSLIKA